MLKLKSYHFDCGNSTDGPTGFCARIRATSPEEALAKLREFMPETIEVETYESSVEYIHVYTCAENVSVADIDEVDDEEG